MWRARIYSALCLPAPPALSPSLEEHGPLPGLIWSSALGSPRPGLFSLDSAFCISDRRDFSARNLQACCHCGHSQTQLWTWIYFVPP
jgi:hypothetical protein